MTDFDFCEECKELTEFKFLGDHRWKCLSCGMVKEEDL